MFFWKKYKIAKDVINFVKPLVGTVQSTSGLPRWFWSDAYILGFVTTVSAHVMRAIGGGKLSDREISFILNRVLNECSSLSANEILKRAGAFARERDDKFLSGAGVASIVYLSSFQNVKSTSELSNAKAAFKAGGLAWSDDAESRYRELITQSDEPASDLLLEFWFHKIWDRKHEH